MKINKLFILSLVALLSACSYSSIMEDNCFYFDTGIRISINNGNKQIIRNIKEIIELFDKVSDNYESKSLFNIYALNQTNEVIYPDENDNFKDELLQLLKVSLEVKDEGATFFNPLCGSLSKKWKEALKQNIVLDNEIIQEELNKIESSSLIIKDDSDGCSIQRIGEAEIDLGAIAKGFALDRVKDYLTYQEFETTRDYIIDAGSSSILLGLNSRKRARKDGSYLISLKDIPNTYFYAKACFVSTSGVSEQGVEIDGVTYSHIINPFDGSAFNLHDSVIVISDSGYYGDAMSTSMMLNTIDEIKQIEKDHNIKTIVIDNGEIAYSNSEIEFKK